MKKNIFYILSLLLLIVVATYSCERDDICAESTPTTPHLIIRFYDFAEPDELKQVRQLTVRGFDADGNELEDIITSTNTDSIVLPLRFDNEMSSSSRFRLEKDTDFADNGNAGNDSNVDFITINYTPEFVYVSRACGYKSIFTNTSIIIESDGNNWIFGNDILNPTIENEARAQIILRH